LVKSLLTRLHALSRTVLQASRTVRKRLKKPLRKKLKRSRRRLEKPVQRKLKQFRKRLRAHPPHRVVEAPEAPAPEEARPTLSPEEARPTLSPEEARPTLSPGETVSETAKVSLLRIPDELIRRGNLDLVNTVVSEDCILHDTEAQTVLYGQDGYKEYVTNVRRALPDILVTVHDQEVKGDRVVTRYSVRGTHAGWLRGAPATGRQVSFSGELETRLAHGRVVEQWNSYDVPSIELQLGVTLQRAART
jgi:steroid delta-isomerase-like uncharacterized protein